MLAVSINQTALYIIAYWLVVLAQRCSEYFFASLESLNPVFYFYGISTSQSGWSAGAVISTYMFGPLLLAFVGFYLVQRWKTLWIKGRMSIAFSLWLSIHALSRLLTGGISGFVTKSGVSQVFTHTGIPVFMEILLAGALYGLFIILARKYALAVLLASHNQRLIDEAPYRRLQVRHFLFIPWLAGASIVSVFNLVFLSFGDILSQFLIGFVLMTTHLHLLTDKPEYNVPIPEPFHPQTSRTLLILAAVLSLLVVIFAH